MGEINGKIYTIAPAAELALETAWTVSCEAGLSGSVGNLGLDKAVDQAFRTYGPLQFVKFEPSGNDIVSDESLRLSIAAAVLRGLGQQRFDIGFRRTAPSQPRPYRDRVPTSVPTFRGGVKRLDTPRNGQRIGSVDLEVVSSSFETTRLPARHRTPKTTQARRAPSLFVPR